MIAAIDFEQQMIENKLVKPDEESKYYAKQKKVYDAKKDDINKVRALLDSWFVSNIPQNDSSLLYPHEVGSQLQLKIQKQIELHDLTMDND